MRGLPRKDRRRRASVALALGALVVLAGIALAPAGAAARPPAPVPSPAFPSGTSTAGPNASVVVGQTNYNRTASGTGPSTFCGPRDAIVDAHGDLWVADSCNNRVLEFVPPLYPGMAASLVLGQPNFTSGAPAGGAAGLDDPTALAFGSGGALWVVDTGNNRVLDFVPPFRTGMAAALVLGQPNLTASAPGTSAAELRAPEGASVGPGGGSLWVADTGNNRVLEFAAPFSTFESARLVIGQKSFTTSAPGTSPSGLAGPTSVAVAANGTVYVADAGNNRVFAYPAPVASGESAIGVLGQTNLYSGGPGLGPSALDGPGSIALGANSTIWVADTQNNRVMRFGLPIVDGEAAEYVAGQPTLFTNSSGPVGAGSLHGPAGVAYDPATTGVWIADTRDARMLDIPGNARLVSSVTVRPSGGDAVALNPLTQVNVTFSSVDDAHSLLVVTQLLSSPPTGEPPAPLANASYFGVAASPPGPGTARACFAVVGVDVSTLPEYWNGSAWESLPTVLSAPGTVCVSMPLFALVGTTFAVPLRAPPPVGSFGVSVLLFATIGFVIAAGLLVIVYNLRRRRRGPSATLEPRYRSPI